MLAVAVSPASPPRKPSGTRPLRHRSSSKNKVPQTPASTQTRQSHATVRLSLDQAIQMAVEHNHNLKAAQTTILQNQAQEITANFGPIPRSLSASNIFRSSSRTRSAGEYLDNNAEFDVGLSYLFERGKKRQHRLQAAQDATAVTRSTVADNERTLVFNVASAVLRRATRRVHARSGAEDQNSFQHTVDISQVRYKAGDISEADFLKIQLQLLQFQSDVSQAQLAKVQALVGLAAVPRLSIGA